MKQADPNRSCTHNKTSKEMLLEQVDQVAPWAALVDLIARCYPKGTSGMLPLSFYTMLRIHVMQQCFTLADPAIEETFFEAPPYREFVQLDPFAWLPSEATIFRFRYCWGKKLAEQILATVSNILIERGLMLKAGTLVDAT